MSWTRAFKGRKADVLTAIEQSLDIPADHRAVLYSSVALMEEFVEEAPDAPMGVTVQASGHQHRGDAPSMININVNAIPMELLSPPSSSF